jgi:hypothetical protein
MKKYHKFSMADFRKKKSTSQGTGGRGRRVRIATSTMNKSKKLSHKKYRGQGR